MNRLTDPKLETARRLFADACRTSRLHSAFAEAGFAAHGDHGALISGCVREHFPEELKNTLRQLARATTELSDLAYAARPRYVRFATMRELSRDIATRDGSGFYGPRARI